MAARSDARKRAQHDHDGAPCWTPTCAPVETSPIVCSAQYGSNPDLCYLPSGHSEPHSNRYGCTWAKERGLPGYTIAPDYAGDPHVWRDDNGRRVPVLSRYHCADARLWEFIVAGIGGAK